MLPQKQQPLVRPMVDTPHLIASLAAVITAVIACLIAPDKLIVFRHKTEQDTLDRKFVKRITAVFAIGTAACAAVLMHHSTLIDGILLTMVDRRTNNANEIIASLRESIGTQLNVFSTEIPRSVRAVEASVTGGSIFEYDRNGKVAQAYEQLAKEVLGLEERSKDRSRTDRVR